MAQQVKVFANTKAARNQSHKAWIHLSTVQTKKLLGSGASSKTGSKVTEKQKEKKRKEEKRKRKPKYKVFLKVPEF